MGHAKKTPLKGQRFESREQAQTYLDRWEANWADTRIHGTTKRQVATMFAEEKPTLLPLPVEPFRYYQYGERVVHLDGCVEVEAAYYDALLYSKTHKRSYRQDKYRMKPLVEEFGNRVADGIDSPELASWLSTKAEESGWKPATANRFKALLSLTYRLGVESKKVSTNPASRSLKRKLENNARVRFLNQFPPAKTTVDYLKPCVDEESRLRAVIATECPQHMLEFEVALHTGMRPSEQYSLTWDKVDLTRRFVTISHSKNGSARHIPLNSVALAAFKTLQKHAGTAVFVTMRGEPLQGYKHWFDPAVEKAGVKDFTWYCLRHTFASRLVMKGVDLPTVRDFMGHKNIQMTCRYAHLAPDHKQAAVEKLCEATATTRKTTRERATEKQSVQAIPTDTRTDTTFAPSL